MKKVILLLAAVIAVSGAMTKASAQTSKKFKGQENDGDKNQHTSSKRQMSVNVSYEDSSTLLTVNFPFNTEGGTVEVFCDGSKVAGITTGGGTTFSCTLQDYGLGNYNIIVSNKKTVVYTKNVVISK